MDKAAGVVGLGPGPQEIGDRAGEEAAARVCDAEAKGMVDAYRGP